MDFRVMDACLMPWNNWFDVIFSNAVFHWIPDHGALLKAVSRILKPRGKLICEWSPSQLKDLHKKRCILIFEEMEKALRDEQWDGSQWVADYRRIRVMASKMSRWPPRRRKGARACRIR